MILTISSPRVYCHVSPAYYVALGITHIFRRSSLQVYSPAEEVLKDTKDAIAREHALRQTEKAQGQLDLSPLSSLYSILKSIAELVEDKSSHLRAGLIDLE